jgi:hypothetical protein
VADTKLGLISYQIPSIPHHCASPHALATRACGCQQECASFFQRLHQLRLNTQFLPCLFSLFLWGFFGCFSHVSISYSVTQSSFLLACLLPANLCLLSLSFSGKSISPVALAKPSFLEPLSAGEMTDTRPSFALALLSDGSVPPPCA